MRLRPSTRRRSGAGGCGCLGVAVLLFLGLLAAYFLYPGRVSLVLLGVDTREADSVVGRTDTIVLMQVSPLQPKISMLSIPRDLWVFIPGVGENRINTAHFFAEANQPGSGPLAVIETIEANFGFRPEYYARVRFSGVREIVDAMGGLDIELEEPTGGLEAGRHHLDGEQALAFARDRQHGDDFGRMRQGQIVIVAAAKRVFNPLTWPRLPAVAAAFFQSVDTDLPAWEWPRVALALARSAGGGIDQRTLTREMTNPFTTDGGAQVLGPNWDLIRPMIAELFGQ
jgi:LCP family protein required for cell wall assembly